MITSIFSKSRPINFVVVFIITLVTFYVAHVKYATASEFSAHLLKHVIVFIACFLSVFILNFLVSKNKLTQKSSYEILLFALFLVAIPQTMLNANIVFANFFILLAIRRVLSLRSKLMIKKKLLDAAIWIGVAALFYFWSILFFPLIYVALFFHGNNNFKEWIIPIVGLAAVFVLAVSCSIVVHNDFFSFLNFSPEVSFDFNNYNTLQYIAGVTLLISFGIWSSVFYLKTIKSKQKDFKPGYKVILAGFFIAIVIMILSPKKEGGEFLFLFAPLAIIIANYLETIQDKWFKEVFLGLLILVPFGLLML